MVIQEEIAKSWIIEKPPAAVTSCCENGNRSYWRQLHIHLHTDIFTYSYIQFTFTAYGGGETWDWHSLCDQAYRSFSSLEQNQLSSIPVKSYIFFCAAIQEEHAGWNASNRIGCDPLKGSRRFYCRHPIPHGMPGIPCRAWRTLFQGLDTEHWVFSKFMQIDTNRNARGNLHLDARLRSELSCAFVVNFNRMSDGSRESEMNPICPVEKMK